WYGAPVSADRRVAGCMGWASLAALTALLPWRGLRTLGALLGFVAGTVLRIRRAHVEAAMRAAGVASPRAEARAMYRSLGSSAAELLWLAARGDEALRHVRIDPASRARWLASLAQGRGVVV